MNSLVENIDDRPVLSVGIRENKRYIHNIECPECHQFRNITHIRKLIYHIPV